MKREFKGKKLFWKYAKEFLEQHNGDMIIISPAVLKELILKLDDLEKISKDYKVTFVDNTDEDYFFARIIESTSSYRISFLDCVHIAICFRLNATLITRDYLLIQEAKKYNVLAIEPEKLLY